MRIRRIAYLAPVSIFMNKELTSFSLLHAVALYFRLHTCPTIWVLDFLQAICSLVTTSFVLFEGPDEIHRLPPVLLEWS